MSDVKISLHISTMLERMFLLLTTFLKRTCCKNNCLRTYGFTLKNFSIEIVTLEEKHIKYANEIITESSDEAFRSL